MSPKELEFVRLLLFLISSWFSELTLNAPKCLSEGEYPGMSL